MLTGQNTRLSMTLMLEQYRRLGIHRSMPRAWVEAGYCLDAPEIMAAGSTVRDTFGPEQDDWVVMPSMVDRESSNVKVTGGGDEK